MANKLNFYDRYGVEEYYIYDPDHGTLEGYLRNVERGQLEPIPEMVGWLSPRLGVHFGLEGTDLVMLAPDGRAFEPMLEVIQGREAAQTQTRDAPTPS